MHYFADVKVSIERIQNIQPFNEPWFSLEPQRRTWVAQRAYTGP